MQPEPFVNETTTLHTRDVRYYIFCRFSFCPWRGETGPPEPPDFNRELCQIEAQQMERDHCRISHGMEAA